MIGPAHIRTTLRTTLAGAALAALAVAGKRRHGIGADHQDRPDQQLFRISRPGRRPDAEGHRPLRQGAREGPAAGRQDRDHQARRYRRPRDRQAPRPGADHPRPRPAAGRRGGVADRRRHRAADPGGQDPAGHHQCGRRRHTAHLALCGAVLLHAVAAGLSARPMGGETELEDGLYGGQRFHPRPRRRGGLHQGLHRCRREDAGLGALPDHQSGFRAVRAAHQGRQARRRLASGRRRASRRPRC